MGVQHFWLGLKGPTDAAEGCNLPQKLKKHSISSLQFAVCSLQFAVCSLQFTVYSLPTPVSPRCQYEKTTNRSRGTHMAPTQLGLKLIGYHIRTVSQQATACNRGLGVLSFLLSFHFLHLSESCFP